MIPLSAALLAGLCVLPARAGDWVPPSAQALIDQTHSAQQQASVGPGLQGETIDLSAQFPDPATREQGDINDCHAFAAVGLLEAAYFRRYGRHVRFSEEDLFLQSTIYNGDIFDGPCANGDCALDEGGWAFRDVDMALKHGVLTGSSYKTFAERYAFYSKRQKEALADMQSIQNHQNPIEKLFYDPRKHWKELQTRPEILKLLTGYLEGHARDFDAERARIKKEFLGFQVSRTYNQYYTDDAGRLPPDQCRVYGSVLCVALLEELRAGRPTAASMMVGGLKAWRNPPEGSGHALLIVGARREGGRYLFKSRNSWGGDNPDVPEDELCRINAITSVHIPGE